GRGFVMSLPWAPLLVSVSLALTLLSGQSGGEETRQPERAATAQEIARLIEKLGSRKFREREEAARALEALGEQALDRLRQAAAKSDDPEVRFRAERLLARLEGHLNGMFSEDPGVVLGLSLSPDGKYVLSAGGPDYLVRLREKKTGKEVRSFAGHTNQV